MLSLAYDIQVGDSKVVSGENGGSKYDAYPITVTMIATGLTWTVNRRYSEFLSFYTSIKRYPELDSFSFPGKVMFQNDDGIRVKRKLAFQGLWRIILAMPSLPAQIISFLDLENAPEELKVGLKKFTSGSSMEAALSNMETESPSKSDQESRSQSPAGNKGASETKGEKPSDLMVETTPMDDNTAGMLLSKPKFARLRPKSRTSNNREKEAQDAQSSAHDDNGSREEAGPERRGGGLEASLLGPKRIQPRGRRGSIQAKAFDRPVSMESPPPGGMVAKKVEQTVLHERPPSLRAEYSNERIPSSDVEWAIQSFNLASTPTAPENKRGAADVLQWLKSYNSVLSKRQIALFLVDQRDVLILCARQACEENNSFIEALADFGKSTGLKTLSGSDELLVELLAVFGQEQSRSKAALRPYERWHEISDLALCALSLHTRLHVNCSHVQGDALMNAFATEVRATTVPPADPVVTYPHTLLEDVYAKIVSGVLNTADRPSGKPQYYLLGDVLFRTTAKVMFQSRGMPERMRILVVPDALYLLDESSAVKRPRHFMALSSIRPEVDADDELLTIRLVNMVSANNDVGVVGYPGQNSYHEKVVQFRMETHELVEEMFDLLNHLTWVLRHGKNSAYCRYTTTETKV